MPLTFNDFCSNKKNVDVAKAADVTESTVRRWRQGYPIPSDALIRMADFYRTSIDRILGHCVPAEEAANPEAFPTRPPVIHTITDDHKVLAGKYRDLQVNNARLEREFKACKEVNERLARQLEDAMQTTIPEVEPESLKAMQETITDLHSNLLALEKASGNRTPEELIAYLNKLQTIQQAVHLLTAP